MPENRACLVETLLATDLSRLGVPELVRMPMRNAGFLASSIDRAAVAVHGVPIAGALAGAPLLAVGLARLHPSFSAPSAASLPRTHIRGQIRCGSKHILGKISPVGTKCE